MKSEQYTRLFNRFRLALSRLEEAQQDLADYWEKLPALCFLYTDGYDSEDKNHNYDTMKAKLIQHVMSFSVLNPGGENHPSTSERHAGIVFDTNERAYHAFNRARADMDEIMKQASNYTEMFAGDGEDRLRPIYYRWFYQAGYTFLRSMAVRRQLYLYNQHCPRMTIGVWRNSIWHPISPQAITTLKLKYPQYAHHLDAYGDDPPLFRFLSRISCRMIVRLDKQPRRSVSLSMPVIYSHYLHPDKLDLCHFLWKNDRNLGRPMEGSVPVPFFSQQENIYYRE